MSCKKAFALFPAGGIGYCLIEIIVRGYTHWSMCIAGGLCLTGLFWLYGKLQKQSLVLKCLAGSAMITGVELAAGVVLNLWLGMGVWSYSSEPLNLAGQICPLYSFYWFLLCIPIMGMFTLPQAIMQWRARRKT